MNIEIRKTEKLFYVKKLNISTTPLSSIIDKIDYDKYNIFKCTNVIRQVTIEDFKNFKHAGYIFFDKNIYNLKHINMWLEWIKDNKIQNFTYISKPFPPIEIFNKIKIM